MKDLELLESLKSFISFSQAIKKDCVQYDFPFFDVSDNWHAIVKLALIHILTCFTSLKNLSQFK
ncbi:MAG: hypothetical protein F6K24_10890 [Okeania sp. SIO2D1]|nr:hypothetical protein [Okeania sp. SIO2D1]